MADFFIKQNDTSPVIQSILKDSAGDPANLTDATVEFHMTDSDGTIKINTSDNVSIVGDPLNGTVKYEWQANGTKDTDVAGEFKAEWEVTYSDGSIETFPNDGSIIILITKELA